MMLRSLDINSPVDDHDDRHLRRLLDERVAHAPFHARYPSVSEFTDTPSVYSHPFFSPRPMAFSDQDANFSSNRGYDQSNWSSTPTQLRRIHDGINDLATSMLDMDDDVSVSLEYQEDEDDLYSQRGSDGEDMSVPRMSLLGPKMRVHSKAPWEVDEALGETNESDSSSHPVSALKRTLKFRAPSSGSGRASDESSRSQSKSKVSLDILMPQLPNPRAALNALSQPSPSTSTLVSTTYSPLSERRNLSGPQSPTLYRTPSPPASPHETMYSHYANSHTRHDSHSDTHSLVRMHSNTSDQHTSSLYHREESHHPYANPDFAVNYARSPPPPRDPALLSTFDVAIASRGHAANFIDESSATNAPNARQALPQAVPPEASDIPSVSRDIRPRKRSSTLHGREISSPMPARFPPDLPPMPPSPNVTKTSPHSTPQPAFANIPGWLERPVSPSFALISLEEARAQRSRSATVNHGSGIPSSRLAHSSTENDVDSDTVSVVYSVDHSSIDAAASRARARSVSAGTRAKQALQSMVGNNPSKFDRRESEPAVHPAQGGIQQTKVLKHKKSGFMKFFNKDKETPPVPSLAESLSAYQIHQLSSKPSKLSTHRIPVPQLSPSLLDADPRPHSDPLDSSAEGGLSQKAPNNPRRTPPLTINTHSSSVTSPSPIPRGGSQTISVPPSLSPISGQRDTVPQSAPAHVTEFPALKLRPVSTVFSSHFHDHLGLATAPPPQLETDSDALSPQSAGTIISPITPSPSAPPPMLAVKPQPSDTASVRSFNIQNDPDAVIKALQDHIVSAKQAWQRQVWELEGQVRDLKAEVEELRTAGEIGYCDACGRGETRAANTGVGVVNRPRARTATSTRFGSAVP